MTSLIDGYGRGGGWATVAVDRAGKIQAVLKELLPVLGKSAGVESDGVAVTVWALRDLLPPNLEPYVQVHLDTHLCMLSTRLQFLRNGIPLCAQHRSIRLLLGRYMLCGSELEVLAT